MRNYLIVANGDFLDKEIIHEAIQGRIIVALDGAADRLAALGFMPDIILGDFDSIQPEAWGIRETYKGLNHDDQPYTGLHGVTIVPAKNQELTDLIKAIHYCDQLDAQEITIICATGGRFDHHEAAVRALRSEYKKQRVIYLHTSRQTLRCIKDETVAMKGETGDKCGIMAFPHGAVSSQGLVYDVRQRELAFGFTDSIGNELRDKEAIISVDGEVLLIMPPMLAAQRL